MGYTINTIELDLFPDDIIIGQNYSATFADNMSLPIHKWYRYTAGFSAVWVNQLIQQEKKWKNKNN